jgi:hypothetical protein
MVQVEGQLKVQIREADDAENANSSGSEWKTTEDKGGPIQSSFHNAATATGDRHPVCL